MCACVLGLVLTIAMFQCCSCVLHGPVCNLCPKGIQSDRAFCYNSTCYVLHTVGLSQFAWQLEVQMLLYWYLGTGTRAARMAAAVVDQ
jgi:hypothetical protein